MNKNCNLMSIGELAKNIGITRRMILNYEDHGLIKPDRKEGGNGNRLYTIDTMTRIKTIRTLQNIGLSLNEIHDYYNGTSDLLPMLRRLEDARDELTISIAKLRERIGDGSKLEIQHTVIPQQTIYRYRLRSNTIAQKTNVLRDAACAAVQAYGIDFTRPMLATEYPLADPYDVSYCISIPPQSSGEHVEIREETSAIMMTYHGAYEELHTIREKLLAYAQQHGFMPLGICRNIYLEGPPQHNDPKKFITQVILPIKVV